MSDDLLTNIISSVKRTGIGIKSKTSRRRKKIIITRLSGSPESLVVGGILRVPLQKLPVDEFGIGKVLQLEQEVGLNVNEFNFITFES